jgi:calcium permeable stress-gated cation channel
VKNPLKKLDKKLDTIKEKVKGELLQTDKVKEKDKDKKDKDKEKEKDAKSKDHNDDGRSSVSSGVESRAGSTHSLHPSSPQAIKADPSENVKEGQLGEAPELAETPPPRPPSAASQASKKSKASSVAVKLDPPAPAAVDLSDEEEGEDEEERDEHAFDHPSTYVEQPWIWIPKDTLGLSELLVEELRSAGVESSNSGATMDEKGIVEVSRNPPDEEWLGGHDK